jgi:hypothetical protein
MAGTFSKASRPRRPGGYVTFDVTQAPIIQPAVGSIVAIPFTHDWGPYKRAVLVGSVAEFQSIYGYSDQSPGYVAVRQAFQGEGLPGRGGAGAVLCYRFGSTSAAKATVTLAPGTVAVTAKYEGVRGNSLRVTVQDFAVDTTKSEFILYDGTVELERYQYVDANVLSDLAAQVNSRSSYVTISGAADGTALTPVSSAALAGGIDGSPVASADWIAAMAALEVERFGVFAPFDLPGTGANGVADVAALKTWVKNLNAAGKRFTAVLGGDTNETVTTAIAAAATLNDENIVRVGNGSVADEGLPDASGNPRILSTSQLAPRIAGIIAAKGEAHSLTFARLAGTTLYNGPTDSQVLQAFDGGVVLLSRDSNVDSPVRVEKGMTTFLSATATPKKPYVIYRNVKYMRTMAGIQMDVQDWSESNVIGLLPVNNKTRDYVLGYCQALLTVREQASVIQPGWTAQVDPDPPPSDDDEYIAVLIGLKFGRSVEQVFFTIRIG